MPVIHYFEYVGMSADENVRTMGLYQLESLVIIPSGVASDMCHQNLEPLKFNQLCLGIVDSDILPVAVPAHSGKWLECGYPGGRLRIAEDSLFISDRIISDLFLD